MTPLNRISTWLNRSVGNRLTAASVATAFGLVTFLALAAFPIFFYQAWQNFSDSSDNAVRPIVDHIDLRLRVIEQNLGQLAKNSFVVNSLVDSTGKEIYLQPTLRDFRLPFDIASSLLIFDANLEPVGSNESASAFMMPEAKLLAGRALKEQKPRIAVRQISGKNVLLVVFPIFYPPASTYEGALVGLLHPEDIVSLEDWPEHEGCAVINAGTRPLLDTGCRFNSGIHTISRGIVGDSRLGQDAPLSVTFGRPVTSLYFTLARILFAYALVGALALVGAYLFSRRLGRDFSQQLDVLSKAALKIAEQPGAPRRVEWNRPDEIGQFVDAFNNMVGSLQEMHATLEQRVLERTAELVASQRDYASLAQAAPVGICRATPAGDCVYVNELWSQISGLSLAEALGKGWLRAIHPDDRDRVFKEWSASVRKQRPFSLEFRLQSTAGVTTWVFGQAMAVTNDNGGVLGYVGTTTNISQRKRAEEATLRAEDRYRSVVENIKEVVFQTDEEGCWTLLNRAWAEITGFAIDETLGKNFLDCVHPDDRDHTLTSFQQLIERKRDFCRHENRYLHKAGGFRWIEVYARLTVDSEGRMRGTSGTLTDITDRHAAEEQLDRMY